MKTIEDVFLNGRTFSVWQDRSVADELLEQAYNLAKMGPTSANCCPLRVVFVKTQEAKEKLKTCLMPGNIDQTISAPVTAILGHDMRFYDKLPVLFPHTDARSWFTGNDGLIATTAFRNGTLQAAYFMMALRAVGLDCGPMSGFDNEGVDALFFQGTEFKSNFLCNIGYGDVSKLHSRGPRLEFKDVCQIV